MAIEIRQDLNFDHYYIPYSYKYTLLLGFQSYFFY